MGVHVCGCIHAWRPEMTLVIITPECYIVCLEIRASHWPGVGQLGLVCWLAILWVQRVFACPHFKCMPPCLAFYVGSEVELRTMCCIVCLHTLLTKLFTPHPHQIVSLMYQTAMPNILVGCGFCVLSSGNMLSVERRRNRSNVYEQWEVERETWNEAVHLSFVGCGKWFPFPFGNANIYCCRFMVTSWMGIC